MEVWRLAARAVKGRSVNGQTSRDALTSEESSARHAGGTPNRWLGRPDPACCLASPQVRPPNADFATAQLSVVSWRTPNTYLTAGAGRGPPPQLPRDPGQPPGPRQSRRAGI